MDINTAIKYKLISHIPKSIQSEELLNELKESLTYETKINVIDAYWSGDKIYVTFDKEITRYVMYTVINDKQIKLIFDKIHQLKYSSKLTYFFPFIDNTIRNKLQADETALFSITAQFLADNISILLQQITLPDKDSVITDACACIGGNTFSFSRFFNKVNSIELDETRYKYLVANLDLLGVQNVTTYQGDYLILSSGIKQNIIFFDPPWGGPDYKNNKNLHLYLGDIDIIKLIYQLLSNKSANTIVLKVPQNFAFTDCIKELSPITNNILKYDMHKFTILIFDTRDKNQFSRNITDVYHKNYLHHVLKNNLYLLDCNKWNKIS